MNTPLARALSAAPAPAPSRRRQRGVSLIELMVGTLIGLLAILVITQVATVYEAQKRSATSGSDAQVNGALALQTLQRDIAMAGYGLSSGGIGNCTLIKGRFGGADYSWTMAPAVITDGGVDGNGRVLPDTLQVVMSNHSGFSLPVRVAADHQKQDMQFLIDSGTNVGNKQGDLMLAVPTLLGQCSLFTVSEAPAGNVLRHDANAGSPWNQDVTNTVFPGATNAAISYAAGSYLLNLGSLVDHTYAIAGGSLQLRSLLSTAPATPTTEALYPQIVNFQAVYGKDTDGDQGVDAWNTTAPTTPAEWAQVLALRIAVVARSSQYEKQVVSAAPPSWKPDGATPVELKVDQLGADWNHYRYRVFETVVPLRNMLWQS